MKNGMFDLTDVAQLVGHQPTKQMVTSSMPGQGTCIDCRFGLHQCFSLISMLLSLYFPLPFPLPLSLSLKKKKGTFIQTYGNLELHHKDAETLSNLN